MIRPFITKLDGCCKSLAIATVRRTVAQCSNLARTALPIGVADQVLLDLADGGARQRVDELDQSRALVAGDPRGNEFDKLLGRWLVARTHNDMRRWNFAPAVVRYAKDRAFEHRRVLEQGIFDFGRVNVLGPGDDHVFRAIHQADEPVPVAHADVAGPQPAVTGPE